MFERAKQIWIKDQEKEMNCAAVIPVRLSKTTNAVLHIGGTAFFRIFANGTFLAFGPARAAEGYLREDEIPLPDGTKEVRIEAVGYYCRSLSTVRQPSFLLAEIRENGRTIWHTAEETAIYAFRQKLTKTERYSVQRHFTEVYDFREGRVPGETDRKEAAVITPKFTVLPRRAPYPKYEEKAVFEASSVGRLTFDESLEAKKYRYSWQAVQEEWGIFPWDEIPYHPHYWIQKQCLTILKRNVSMPETLGENDFALFDFHAIEAGFLKLKITCEKESDVVLAYAEHTDGETFAYPNLNVHNAVEWLLPEGDHELATFEPYSARLLMVAVKSGEIRVESAGIVTYESDDRTYYRPAIRDPELKAIFDSAVRNYCHNSVDLFTDCPSRERAGWLGDAYFTAKAEYFLTGETRTEDAYLENLRLYEDRQELPHGARPETYPSDVPGVGGHGESMKDPAFGTFIPQYDLWLLLETAEYMTIRGHLSEKDVFLPMTEEMLGFFEAYENEEGLLEDLPSWNFIEWSKANDWAKNVNYPTNFLYAEVLSRLGAIYGRKEWTEKAEKIRTTSVRESFDGRCFRDHAVRDEAGKLVVQPEKSEACQYYALLYGDPDGDEQKYAELNRMIRESFAFGRPYDGDVLPAEMIFGLYLRIELFMKRGDVEGLKRDVLGIFGKMHEGTETLWEYLSGKGSRDHGMCSYITLAIAMIEQAERTE